MDVHFKTYLHHGNLDGTRTQGLASCFATLSHGLWRLTLWWYDDTCNMEVQRFAAIANDIKSGHMDDTITRCELIFSHFPRQASPQKTTLTVHRRSFVSLQCDNGQWRWDVISPGHLCGKSWTTGFTCRSVEDFGRRRDATFQMRGAERTGYLSLRLRCFLMTKLVCRMFVDVFWVW